mmetsp:Transcript_26008/g.46988  ORF Transcript_26008/g.46988 Transcript_26008/m.46988 type:complete len:120 (-) Transcript_26008:332-691(-)
MEQTRWPTRAMVVEKVMVVEKAPAEHHAENMQRAHANTVTAVDTLTTEVPLLPERVPDLAGTLPRANVGLEIAADMFMQEVAQKRPREPQPMLRSHSIRPWLDPCPLDQRCRLTKLKAV